MITSAAEYHAAFVAAAADGTLVQDNRFTAEAGGTELCPMLAILGEGVASAADCPATVMPQWLAQLVPALFNLQPLDQALEWGSEYTALFGVSTYGPEKGLRIMEGLGLVEVT